MAFEAFFNFKSNCPGFRALKLPPRALQQRYQQRKIVDAIEDL